MSTTYIGAELRRQVIQRAANCCEYCLIHEDDTFFGCQIDHIISEKHGGTTDSENLALACSFCNWHKGSDIGSLTIDGLYIRFFNPRTDYWLDHFSLQNSVIEPISPIDAVTAKIFQFNTNERIIERQSLMEVGLYPRNFTRSKSEKIN